MGFQFISLVEEKVPEVESVTEVIEGPGGLRLVPS